MAIVPGWYSHPPIGNSCFRIWHNTAPESRLRLIVHSMFPDGVTNEGRMSEFVGSIAVAVSSVRT